MGLYLDFFTMSDAILAHVASTKAAIKRCDDPAKVMIGFSTEDEVTKFQIRQVFIRPTLLPDPVQRGRFIKYLQTSEGRDQMAAGFSKGERIWLGNGVPPEFKSAPSV